MNTAATFRGNTGQRAFDSLGIWMGSIWMPAVKRNAISYLMRTHFVIARSAATWQSR